MTNTASGIQQLQAVFSKINISSGSRSDHIVLKSSKTEKQIREIVESAKFCPLISENKIGGNFIISMVPYRIPESFCKDAYFAFNEISSLFKNAIYPYRANVKDPNDGINFFRGFVSLALNTALTEVVKKCAKDDLPIVHIGSQIGYAISEKLSSMTIRTQTRDDECLLLNQSGKNPVYQIGVREIHSSLLKMGKKIPLFYAMNVFDGMPSSSRRESFLLLSELQNAGDHILILLDVNPGIIVFFEELKSLYPKHNFFPYFPPTFECASLSLIVVPRISDQYISSLEEIIEMVDTESRASSRGETTPFQKGLHELIAKSNLEIINMEEFFIERIKKDLEEAGYEADVYYHAAFEVGNLSAGLSPSSQDLVYRAVSDTAALRQWSLTDQKLLDELSKKGLSIPKHFDEDFLRSMRARGQKILGAEILVIEATKK